MDVERACRDFSLTACAREAGYDAPNLDWSSREYSEFSLPPRCPRPIGTRVRRYDGGAVRDSAAPGRDTEWAPAGVSTLAAADAEDDGRNGITEATE
jgi:hypothetical protein